MYVKSDEDFRSDMEVGQQGEDAVAEWFRDIGITVEQPGKGLGHKPIGSPDKPRTHDLVIGGKVLEVKHVSNHFDQHGIQYEPQYIETLDTYERKRRERKLPDLYIVRCRGNGCTVAYHPLHVHQIGNDRLRGLMMSAYFSRRAFWWDVFALLGFAPEHIDPHWHGVQEVQTTVPPQSQPPESDPVPGSPAAS